MDILLKNNTGNQKKDTLVNGFVVRLKPMSLILNELKLSRSDKPEQNYLIIGQRGAGKTTLLYRLKYAIEDDPELSAVIPLMFGEEQYHVIELSDLWETVSEYLNDHPGFEGIADAVSSQISGGKYDEEKAYDIIEERLKKNNRKIILFVENIDAMLKKFGREGQQRLREVLSTSKNIRIIGSATTYFEGIVNYSDPFYDFFKTIQLNGLSKSDTYKLLLKIAQQTNETKEMEVILKRNPRRVEALRRLTGGNPRMIAYLYQIFLDNANGEALKDLYQLLDDLTFLYKAELDQLSPQHQKIVDVIARNWDAISVKEIVAATRMLSKHVSSVILALEKNQVIERISTKNKNNLYRLKDRFLNIWYLMRFGKKKERENIIWLVRFYDVWCDKLELSERVLHLYKNLLVGEYDDQAAVAMVSTFLACKNVSPADKYRLFKTSKLALPLHLIRDLRLSQKDWYENIKELVRKGKYDQAIDVVNEMGAEEVIYDTYLYWIYYNQQNFGKALEHLLRLYQHKGDPSTAYTLGELYENTFQEYDQAIAYYELALNGKKYIAAHRLGLIYHFKKDDDVKAADYFKTAIAHDIAPAILGLANLRFYERRLPEAKTLFLQAIEKGQTRAYVKLGQLMEKEGDLDEAETLFRKAITVREYQALLELSDLLLDKTNDNQEEAKALLEEALQKEVHGSYYALGKYLLRIEGDEKAAKKILEKGYQKGDEHATHLLAHLYQEMKKFDKAEEMFIRSFEMGKKYSLICLANGAFHSRRYDRKELILELFRSRMMPFDSPLVEIEYDKLLVWNEKYDEAVRRFRDIEPQMSVILNGENEEYKEQLISAMISLFIRLAAKKQFNLLSGLFEEGEVDYRQILKPVYYAVMRHMKDEFPNEYLKAGSELNETIDEIIVKIEKVRALA